MEKKQKKIKSHQGKQHSRQTDRQTTKKSTNNTDLKADKKCINQNKNIRKWLVKVAERQTDTDRQARRET